jgi:hypothetical protein
VSRTLRLAVTATYFCVTSGAAVGAKVVRLMDLGVLAVASSSSRPWRHGVHPRPMDLNSYVILVFNGGILLQLLQSSQAIVLPLISGCWLLLAGPGVIFLGTGLRQRWSPASQANRGFPKGFFVISFSSRGSCVSLVGIAILCTCCVCVPVCTVSCTF